MVPFSGWLFYFVSHIHLTHSMTHFPMLTKKKKKKKKTTVQGGERSQNVDV